MRILVLHNYYQQSGGEDRVFESEARLLESHGHKVVRFVKSNDDVSRQTVSKSFVNALWNRTVANELDCLLKDFRPDIAHVHNVFSVMSPSVYHVLHRAGVPVVQTLHNYRLACPNARFMRGGQFCALCCGRGLAWPAIYYRCYQAGFLPSLGMVSVLALHRFLRTWSHCVDLYLAPSSYMRQKMISAGLPDERILLKPHCVPDPGELDRKDGGYALFLGRLESEKGILELLDAWCLLPGFPLHIAGDGPLSQVVRERLKHSALTHVSMLGWLSRDEIEHQLAHARFIVVPSLGPESFGLSVVEAFSYGIPVLASSSGALPDLVRDGQNGLIANPCDSVALASQARRLYEDNMLRDELGRCARKDYLSHYSLTAGYEALVNSYECAADKHNLRS